MIIELVDTYTMTLSWIPTVGQAGPQGFCAAAVDSLNQQSDQWCITFVVGANSPNLNTPTLVQGSASPLGTVFANQSLFSIQGISLYLHYFLIRSSFTFVFSKQVSKPTVSKWYKYLL
jgi:hypothetical protein